ncbi:MAG: chloride channel protein [Acidobacteriia bacterium]|nr:chloride channel protein [Terriglobia bacterium]
MRSAWASGRWHLPLSEDHLFLLLAVIIGVYSGLAVVLFRIAIEWTRVRFLGSTLAPSWPRVVLVPVVIGLVVAFLVMHFFPRVRGSGVNQTKAAMYIYAGFIPFNTVIGKFLTCALAIGSGQSLGPEDPSLQIGAGIASALGRRLRLTRQKVRLIAPVGAAAGLAAAFNSPISAVLFVIEEVIGKWSAGVLGAIVLAAVSGVVVERSFLGEEPLFRIPAYHLVHPAELLAYAALGVVGGFASLLFVKLIAWSRPHLKRLPRTTQYFQPALAGLLIGLMGIWLPQVMGAGYVFIDQAMHDQFTWRVLALLGAFKILSTSLSFVSGTPGGMFAPTLFIGAMVGGAVGGVEHHFFPWLTGSVGAYALVGMGVFFAGFLRAPFTSVFMILELSGNYSIIVPVMISNTIAYLISRRFQAVPLFDMLSRQDGMDLPSMEEQREATTLRVEDAMRPYAGPLFRDEDRVAEALRRAEDSPADVYLLPGANGAWRGFRQQALQKIVNEGNGAMPLGIDTASLFAITFGILGPAYLATHNAELAWKIAMAVMVLAGLFKMAVSFIAPRIRDLLPRVGMLGSIAAIAILLIAFFPTLKVFESPLVGFDSLIIILVALVGKYKLPFKIPGALAGVLAGMVIFYGLYFLGLSQEAARLFTQPHSLQFAFPWPTLNFLGGLVDALPYMAIALPLVLTVIVGGIDVTESAAAVGDEYSARQIIMTDGLATLVVGLCGGVLQTTPYIGHPAYKQMGGGAGYTLAVALFIGLGAILGYLSSSWILSPRRRWRPS